MVLIGFVLIAAAAVVGIDVAAQNNFAVNVDAFGQILSTTAAIVFVGGVVTGLVACLGIMLFRDGFARSRRVRAERREQALERERMAAAYEREHSLDREDEGRDLDLRDRTLRDREMHEREADSEHVTSF
jgi:uncharacterized membrane protein YciS (DUF1049 family)